MSGALVPACVWRATPALIVALDATFGEPLDTYVNGSQVWLRPEGPDELVVEWRLHPVAAYRRPAGTATEDVFASAALAFGTGGSPPAPLDRLWDGLEAFPAYGDDVEPQTLAQLATTAMGLTPDAVGLVDHEVIGDRWERSGGTISIVGALLAQLATGDEPPETGL